MSDRSLAESRANDPKRITASRCGNFENLSTSFSMVKRSFSYMLSLTSLSVLTIFGGARRFRYLLMFLLFVY